MTSAKEPADPKTPTTGISGRESVFDKRLRELRTTGQFSKPDIKANQFVQKRNTSEFSTPSMDSKLAHSRSNDEDFTEIERKAFIDEASGLYNSRTILAKLAVEMRRTARYKHKFCLMAVELDRGAQLLELTEMAQELAFVSFCKMVDRSIREVDYIGRFDDRCLLIICPETSTNEALMEAERLRNYVDLASPKQIGQHVNLTASIGVACYNGQTVAPVELLGAALEAVQKAIAGGGNTVCAAESPQESILDAVQASEDFSPSFDASPDASADTSTPRDLSDSKDSAEAQSAFPPAPGVNQTVN